MFTTTVLCMNDEIHPTKENTLFPQSISVMLPQGDNCSYNDLTSYADNICLKMPYKNSRSLSSDSNATDDTNLLSVLSDTSTSSSCLPDPEVEPMAAPMPTPPPPPRKSVRFDKITIREYDITVGDNPACTAGAPITLAWEYNPITEQFPVDVYENYRDGQRCGPEDLKLNERVRHRLLLEWDVPFSKIRRAERRCRLAQDQRRQTIECLIQEEAKAKKLSIDAGSGHPRFLKNIKDTFSRIFLKPDY